MKLTHFAHCIFSIPHCAPSYFKVRESIFTIGDFSRSSRQVQLNRSGQKFLDQDEQDCPFLPHAHAPFGLRHKLETFIRAQLLVEVSPALDGTFSAKRLDKQIDG